MDEDDARKCVEEHIRAYHPTDADKLIKKLNRLGVKEINRTYAALFRMQLRGFPLSVFHAKLATDWLQGALENASTTTSSTEEPTDKKVVSVQDRIRNQVRPVLAEIDFYTDCLLDNEEADKAGLDTLIHNVEFKAPHLRVIESHIEQYLREWGDALNLKSSREELSSEEDQQLADGYSFFTLRQLKSAIADLSAVHQQVRATAVAVKPVRKRRPRTTEQIVKKLRYKVEDTGLGLQSINPRELLGASVVFVFNTKRQKLGMYVGEFAGSIDLKRSTLLGVNEAASGFKKLRKPAEQLKEFMALRKGSGKKYFEKIRTKPSVARVRLNADTLILKAE